MLIRTHLAFGILITIALINYVNNKFIFIGAALIATILPDIDTGFSNLGDSILFKPLQLFVKHRGIIHSLTAAVALSIVLAVLWPVASLGFFAGYSFHVLADSFTKEGIQPFWPLKYRSQGFIKTGGKIEESIFLFLAVMDVILIILSTFMFF